MLQYEIDRYLKLDLEGKISNKDEIIKMIRQKLNINSLDLWIDDDESYFIKLMLKDSCIEDYIYEMSEDKVIMKSIIDLFDDLPYDVLELTLFSIYRIMDSMRLDLVQETSKDTWYRTRFDDRWMINKAYFKNSLINYRLYDDLSNVYLAYIMATSSASEGGLLSVRHFEILNTEDKVELLIKGTTITYYDLINRILQDDQIVSLIEKNLEVDARVMLEIISYSLNWLRTLPESPDETYIPHIEKARVGYKLTRSKEVFMDDEFSIIESSEFNEVDFSNQELSTDFINCVFINCDFTNSKPLDIIVLGRFPFIQCKFINCKGLTNNSELKEVLL